MITVWWSAGFILSKEFSSELFCVERGYVIMRVCVCVCVCVF